MKSKNKNKMAKAKKTLAAPPAQLSDLTLTLNGNTLTTTISPNAQWSGIQKFTDKTSNEGAVSILNRNYATQGSAPESESVAAQGAGSYRGWTSDFNYDIHYSNWVDIN